MCANSVIDGCTHNNCNKLILRMAHSVYTIGSLHTKIQTLQMSHHPSELLLSTPVESPFLTVPLHVAPPPPKNTPLFTCLPRSQPTVADDLAAQKSRNFSRLQSGKINNLTSPGTCPLPDDLYCKVKPIQHTAS